MRTSPHSDDDIGPSSCISVVNPSIGCKVSKDTHGLGDDGTMGGVRTVMSGGRGLGGSISTTSAGKSNMEVVELTKLDFGNSSGVLHVPPRLLPRVRYVPKDHLGRSLRPIQSLIALLSRRILKPVTGTVLIYLAPHIVRKGLSNAKNSELLVPGLITAWKLQYVIFFTFRSRDRRIELLKDYHVQVMRLTRISENRILFP